MRFVHPMLLPFGNLANESFTSLHAAHLLNRAGFGGTPGEVARVLELGPVKAVEALLGFPDLSAEAQDPAHLPDLDPLDEFPRADADWRRLNADQSEEERREIRQRFNQANQQTLLNTTGWWLKRMGAGKFPLQEKLTLFWHGHFTTSARDERRTLLIWRQNELLRRFAAGNFKQFVLEVSRDPAMLSYLNNNQNRKQRPNENYARELMELFTLGIGNYTEEDVKAAARAFTGWGHDGDAFVFRRNQHDTGPKRFLGRIGGFGGGDVINLILQHPACAPYICRRLYAFFVKDPPDELLVNSLARLLRRSDWNLRPVLQVLLSSRAFYRQDVIGQQIKSPVQLVVGTLRLLGMDTPDPRRLIRALEQMGQLPFHPPNVKGWGGGRTWINTATLLVRYNTASNLVSKATMKPLPADVELLVERLVARPIAPDKRRVLVDQLKRDASPAGVRKVIQLMVAMPEYQLC